MKIFTARQRSCRKVIFSHVSVCHSVHRGPHVSITHDVLNFNIQGSSGPGPSSSPYSLYRKSPKPPPQVSSGGQDWGPGQTGSLEDPLVLTSEAYVVMSG